MAWTEQCKIAFKSNAQALIWKQKRKTKKNISSILRKLSKESGIPFKTLERWYYEKNSLNNEGTIETTGTNENNTGNNTNAIQFNQDGQAKTDKAPVPICKNCEKFKNEKMLFM